LSLNRKGERERERGRERKREREREREREMLRVHSGWLITRSIRIVESSPIALYMYSLQDFIEKGFQI
jgi:hypothetical protein